MPKTKKNSPLKASLAAHQARVAKKAKEEEGRKSAYVKNLGGKNKNKKKDKGKGNANVTIPFTKAEKILLVGEGNFSFALSLFASSSQYASAPNVIATAYDTSEVCFGKYPDAPDIVAKLRELGVLVLFGVDARSLEKCSELRKWSADRGGFDKIVFNFPHAGAGITSQDRNILTNQHLILGFLNSVSSFLAKGDGSISTTAHSSVKSKAKKADEEDDEEYMSPQDDDPDEDAENTSEIRKAFTLASTFRNSGSVLITLRDAVPYTLWDIPGLAKHPPPTGSPQASFTIVRSFAFHPEAYPGYEHRRTIGFVEGKSSSANEDILREGEGQGKGCRTWEFRLKDVDE